MVHDVLCLIVDRNGMDQIELRILDQYWISKEENDTADLCSHGLISLKFNDVEISNEHDNDWTISTSGLAFLRSINNDHQVGVEAPMIPHCGALGLIGCPICIDWTIKHNDNSIRISDIRKYTSTSTASYKKFDLELIIDRKKYIREVVRYCDVIKDFFKNQVKIFESNYDKEEWISFWAEFDNLLDKSRNELKNSGQ